MTNFIVNNKKYIEACDIIYDLIDEIKNHLDEEGLYRKSGKEEEFKKALSKINRKPKGKFNYSKYNIHVLTSILKLTVRDLDPPIMPKEIIDKFIAEYDTTSMAQKEDQIRNGIESLSDNQKKMLRALMRHILEVIKHENVNKMTKDNMCIIWAPALYCEMDTPIAVQRSLNFVSILLELYGKETSRKFTKTIVINMKNKDGQKQEKFTMKLQSETKDFVITASNCSDIPGIVTDKTIDHDFEKLSNEDYLQERVKENSEHDKNQQADVAITSSNTVANFAILDGQN